jgi:poly-gamma-glutamate synthesis protein (capsule biosynthesis protein)
MGRSPAHDLAGGVAIIRPSSFARAAIPMPMTLLLTGDVNLMNVTDPAVPFRRVVEELRAADIVFSNLECCLYAPPQGHSVDSEGFYAAPGAGGDALRHAGIRAVGIANNVNYGEAAIPASVAPLDELGIAHTGAGANRAAAGAPIVLEREGVRTGFLQRSSVCWPTNHEAGDSTGGVAVIRGHTAYQLPLHRTRPEIPPANRPGCRPSSSPGPILNTCSGFGRTSRRCVRERTSSSPRAIGGLVRKCCNT